MWFGASLGLFLRAVALLYAPFPLLHSSGLPQFFWQHKHMWPHTEILVGFSSLLISEAACPYRPVARALCVCVCAPFPSPPHTDEQGYQIV